MNKKEYSVDVAGIPLIAEFTDLAEQASGSVIVRYGDTVILVTAVISKKQREGDFFPLTVDYEERFYAAGQILGSRFMRREGRPTEEAVLSGRIVDRTIRPLFDSSIRNEVQVVITVLSLGTFDPDVLAVIGASLALGTSPIPWNGPVSAIRIGRTSDSENFIVNPTYEQRAGVSYTADVLACGKENLINMIEVGGKELSEADVMAALTKASEEIEKIQKFQKDIIARRGAQKLIIEKPTISKEAEVLYEKMIAPKLSKAVFSGPGKKETEELMDEWLQTLSEQFPEEKTGVAAAFFDEKVDALIHDKAIDEGKRPDGRGFDEVRPLFAKAGGMSPALHGSGIFYRGGTHILSVCTLAGPDASQIMEGMEIQGKKRFIHHYNFPPFSTGETGRMGGMNRRMIGHGALAEKALIPIIPEKEAFPYTIRLVSEALASNGSTSMGSVCGSTLALMDAGVPIKAPVAGIASGLMMRSPKEYKVLTDIQGPEDHHGDMDFKVAGTKEGITAVQMDVKVNGIPLPILAEAFEKAKSARLRILEVITKELAAPRPDISPSAPKIISIKIKPDQIGLVIGTGGKTIKEIQEKTGAEISIEDDGTVFFTGKNGSAEQAKALVEGMTREYKVGDRFEGPVVRFLDFGAFVNIGPGQDGLVHISEIAPWRIERITDLIQEGEVVPVVVSEVDEKGRVNLSILKADPKWAEKKLGGVPENAQPNMGRPPRREGPPRHGGFGDRRGGGGHRPH